MSKAKEILEKLKDKVFMTEKGLVSFAPIIGEAIADIDAKNEEIKLLKQCVEEAIKRPMGVEPSIYSDYKMSKENA